MKRRLVLAGLLLVSLLSGGVTPVIAQSTPAPIEEEAPIYNNSSGETNMTDWSPNDGNATADGMLEMVARIPGMFIGSGGMDPSGSGYEGVLLTALVIGASALFATTGTNVGPVAGSMIGIVLAFGLTTIGLVPVWIRPLLLFALVGVPAATAIIRVFRG